MTTFRVRESSQAATKKMVAMLAAIVLALLTFINLGGDSSHAASMGPGIEYGEVGHIGAYRLADGTLAYCVELAVLEPWDEQSGSELVTSLPAFSGSEGSGWMFGFTGQVEGPAVSDSEIIRRINYVIDKWGQTSNDAQASAVALAVFELRGDSSGFFASLIEAIRGEGGGAQVDWARQMISDAQANAVAPRQPEDVPAPVLQMGAEGSGQLQFSAGTTRLQLTNAIFADGSSARNLDGVSGGSLEIFGVKPAGWDSTYEVEVQSESKSGREGWPAQLVLHHPSVSGQQRIVVASGLSSGTVRHSSARVSATIESFWWPTISTKVTQKVVDQGDKFEDVVTISADKDGSQWSVNNQGSFMPVVLSGTLYGPLDSDPSINPLDDAPDWAPVAAEVTLLADSGPGDYTVSSGVRARVSGYYTWVWKVELETQSSEVLAPERTGKSSLDLTKLPIKDRFGEVAETQLLSQRVTLVTRLKEGLIGRGWSLIDEIGVAKERLGGWLKDENGSPIPVVLRGTMFHSDNMPEQSENAPAESEAISHTLITVQGSQIVDSSPIPVPAHLDGYVTLQWCVLAEDQPEAYAEMTTEICDDYGVPSETAKIESPVVTTLAQEEAVVGEQIVDTALIEGLVPHAASIEFTAYLLPELGHKVYDENWKEITTQKGQPKKWSADDIELLEENLCMAQPVAVTPRQSVFETGMIESHPVTTESVGVIHWVERLYAQDSVSGEDVLIHEGQCGLVEETTLVKQKPELPEPPKQPKKAKLADTGRSKLAVSSLGAVGFALFAAGTLMFWRERREK